MSTLNPGRPSPEGAGASPVASFPEGSWVEVRFPLTSEQEHGDRGAWPWLPGWVVSQCGHDEWAICVQHPQLAMHDEGETTYPVCFRDASEIRIPSAEAGQHQPEAEP